MTAEQLRNSILQQAISGRLVPPAYRQAGKTLTMNPTPHLQGKKVWFTYVIECEDGTFYKGFTDDLVKRYKQHCDGIGAEHTKIHKPKQLYYWEMHYSQKEAIAREKYLKSGSGREWFLREVVNKPENWEPASVLLEKIRDEKARLIKEGKLKKEKPSAPITDDEKPFEIPASWEWVRFFTVYSLETNLVNPQAYLNYQHIAPDNIEKKSGKLLQCKTVKEDKVISYNHFFSKGQIIYSKIRPLLRKAVIAPFDGLCSADMYPLSTSMYIKYALLYLLSDVFNNQVSAICSSRVKMPKINQEELSTIIVPLPPLAEQQRIVAKLEELLPIVEQYGKAQAELDELNAALPARLRQSVLQQAIQGKLVPQDEKEGTAEELLKQIEEEKVRLQIKKNKKAETLTLEEAPFDIPETWKWCLLGDLAAEDMGKTPPRGESIYWANAKYPWVSIADMKDYGRIKTAKEAVSEYAAEKAFREISLAGSLLMSFKLTVGRTSILDIDAYHNEAIITIKPFVDKDYAFRNYLFYILPLIANMGDSKDAIKGKTLNSISLYALPIPLPPLAEQKRIVAKIEELFAEIDKLQAKRTL